MALLCKIPVICLVFRSSSSQNQIKISEEDEYIMKMLTKATHAICWYEHLKRLPPRLSMQKTYDQCIAQTNFSYAATNPIWSDSPSGYDGMLNEGLGHGFDSEISTDYSRCLNLLEEPMTSIEPGYQQFFEDKKNYKYKNIAHCLLLTLEGLYGKEAISDVEQYDKDRPTFLTTMFNRGNELRALDGVPPLKLHHELTKLAQIMAEALAKNAFSWRYTYPLEYRLTDYKFRGDSCGESADYTSSTDTDVSMWFEDDELALMMSNQWYIEHQYYSWPAYNGEEPKYHFKYFTQQVWKSSKLVGYGMAKSDRKGTNIVAVYWPPANPTDKDSIHMYAENVLPLK